DRQPGPGKDLRDLGSEHIVSLEQLRIGGDVAAGGDLIAKVLDAVGSLHRRSVRRCCAAAAITGFAGAAYRQTRMPPRRSWYYEDRGRPARTGECGDMAMPRITGVAPFFLVADVTRAAEYYRDKLGFSIIGYFFEEPPVFAMVGRDDRIVMLSLMDDGRRGGSNRGHKEEALDAYFWVDDADALYAEFQQSGADIVSPPQLRI